VSKILNVSVCIPDFIADVTGIRMAIGSIEAALGVWRKNPESLVDKLIHVEDANSTQYSIKVGVCE